MQLSTLIIIISCCMILFSFITRNLDYAIKVLNVDALKLKQSINHIKTRHQTLKNIDPTNLEMN